MSAETLQVVPYDRRWPEQFEAERRRLATALGAIAVRIDHNGSTSVPGLAAKPIIDIQISVTQVQALETFATPLRQLGYTHVPHPDDAFCPFFHRPATWPHTHHVHVAERGGSEERRTLAFRDYLRIHPKARHEYAALKLNLAPQFSATTFGERQAYADAKTGLIEQFIARALEEGLPHDL